MSAARETWQQDGIYNLSIYLLQWGNIEQPFNHGTLNPIECKYEI